MRNTYLAVIKDLRTDLRVYIGALIMFLAATAMGVTVIASGLELIGLGHGTLAFLMATTAGWGGASLVGDA